MNSAFTSLGRIMRGGASVSFVVWGLLLVITGLLVVPSIPTCQARQELAAAASGDHPPVPEVRVSTANRLRIPRVTHPPKLEEKSSFTRPSNGSPGGAIAPSLTTLASG
jgi:hypothetical protein